MRPNSSPCPTVTRPTQGLSLALVHRLRDRSIRDSRGLFLAEGVRFLSRAVEFNWPIAGLVVCPRLLTSSEGNSLVRCLVGRGVPRFKILIEEFDELSNSSTATEEERRQGVIIVAKQQWISLPEQIRPDELWLGVESIRSPGNLGTLLRTSEAAGVTRQVLFDRSPDGSPLGVDPFDPGCVRASMGSVFSQTFTRTTHHEFRNWQRKNSIRVTGASGEGEVDYRSVDFSGPTMLMLGDERKGLSAGQRGTCEGLARIPMCGSPDSLNVAMAGTILLYEAFVQRHPLPRPVKAILRP